MRDLARLLEDAGRGLAAALGAAIDALGFGLDDLLGDRVLVLDQLRAAHGLDALAGAFLPGFIGGDDDQLVAWLVALAQRHEVGDGVDDDRLGAGDGVAGLAGEFLHHVRRRGDGHRVGVHQLGDGQLHGAFAGAHLADDDAGVAFLEDAADGGDDVLLGREQACLFAAGQRLLGHEGAQDLPLLRRGAGVQGRVAVLHDLMQQRAVPLEQVVQLVGTAEDLVAAGAGDAVDLGGEALGPGLAAGRILVDELAVFVLRDDLLAGRPAHEHVAQVDGLELAGGDQGADVAGAQPDDRPEVDWGRLAQALPIGGECCAFLVDQLGGFLKGQLRAPEDHLGLRQ